MKNMEYKGYTANVEYDAEDRIFIGRVGGLRDIIVFHGDTVDTLESAFRESVDDYLSACKKIGQQPEKPASGKMMLRISPRVHGAALAAAKAEGTSLNQWAEKVLDAAARH